MDVDSITQLYQYLEPRVLLRLVTCSKSLLQGLTYKLALRSIYRNGGPTAKSAVSVRYTTFARCFTTRLTVIKFVRTLHNMNVNISAAVYEYAKHYHDNTRELS